MREPEEEEPKIACSSLGFISGTVVPKTYRSIFIPPNGSDRDKANAIDDLLSKMKWTQKLCTGDCENDTHECKATGLASKIDVDDCELSLEKEEDGTTYYKAVVKKPGNVELKCPGKDIDEEHYCKCLEKSSG